MADHHDAVREMLQAIPNDSKFGPNKISSYNTIFRAMEKHGYKDEIERFRDKIVSETTADQNHHLPSAKRACRLLCGITGVDEDLENDLPGQF